MKVSETALTKQIEQYTNHGFCLFEHDAAILNWVDSVLPAARKAVKAKQNQHWFRHGDTWFVGVNVLPNDRYGRLSNGPRLTGTAVNFIEKVITKKSLNLDRAQISVCYPEYPLPSSDESDSAFAYRLRRDAAHVDGIMRQGEHRYLVERHDYIFALPVTQFSHDAAPFVVWKGSHKIIQAALSNFLAGFPVAQWNTVPVNDVYNEARKKVFADCQRIELALKPGQSFVGHRHILHGTASWGSSASSGPDGRMLCFFRPESFSIKQWVLVNN